MQILFHVDIKAPVIQILVTEIKLNINEKLEFKELNNIYMDSNKDAIQ